MLSAEDVEESIGALESRIRLLERENAALRASQARTDALNQEETP